MLCTACTAAQRHMCSQHSSVERPAVLHFCRSGMWALAGQCNPRERGLWIPVSCQLVLGGLLSAVRKCCAGIGRSITRIDQIDVLKRPLTMEEGGVVLMDLLWSDPTTNDGVEGVQPSPRGPGLVTFGPDRVKEFCKVRAAHNLEL